MSIMNDILICYECNIWSFTQTPVAAENHHISLWLVAEFVLDKGQNIWSFTVVLILAKAATFVWCQMPLHLSRASMMNYKLNTYIIVLVIGKRNKLLIHVLSSYYTVYLLYNIPEYPFLYIILLTQSVYVFKVEPFQTSCCCRRHSRRLLHCTSQVTRLLGIANQTGALWHQTKIEWKLCLLPISLRLD